MSVSGKRLSLLAVLVLAGLVAWFWVDQFDEASRGRARVAAVQPVSSADAEQPADATETPSLASGTVPLWWPRFERAMAKNSERRFAEAEEELRRILSDVERESGPGHPLAGLLHFHLAMIHGNQRRLADREAELKRALEIFEAKPVRVVKAALGPMGGTLDREIVARDLGDLLWNQRRAADAYGYYEKAYVAAQELDAPEVVRNDRLALAAAGVMVTSCTLQKWDDAERAMAEVKRRYPTVSPGVQPRLKYWIDSGEARLKARNCS